MLIVSISRAWYFYNTSPIVLLMFDWRKGFFFILDIINRVAAPNTATAQMRYIDNEYMDIRPVNDGDILCNGV